MSIDTCAHCGEHLTGKNRRYAYSGIGRIWPLCPECANTVAEMIEIFVDSKETKEDETDTVLDEQR